MLTSWKYTAKIKAVPPPLEGAADRMGGPSSLAQGVRMNVSPAQAAFLIRVLERGIRGVQAVAA